MCSRPTHFKHIAQHKTQTQYVNYFWIIPSQDYGILLIIATNSNLIIRASIKASNWINITYEIGVQHMHFSFLIWCIESSILTFSVECMQSTVTFFSAKGTSKYNFLVFIVFLSEMLQFNFLMFLLITVLAWTRWACISSQTLYD